MAKITVTFEDEPGGRVAITSDPPIEALSAQATAAGALRGAAGYAAAAWAVALQLSREPGSTV